MVVLVGLAQNEASPVRQLNDKHTHVCGVYMYVVNENEL